MLGHGSVLTNTTTRSLSECFICSESPVYRSACMGQQLWHNGYNFGLPIWSWVWITSGAGFFSLSILSVTRLLTDKTLHYRFFRKKIYLAVQLEAEQGTCKTSLKRLMPRHSYNNSLLANFFTAPYQVQIFCSTGMPPASTRWIWSTFLNHFPLSSNQQCCLTTATSIIFPLKIFQECWELNPGLLGEKQEHHLCAMQPPITDLLFKIFGSICLSQLLITQKQLRPHQNFCCDVGVAGQAGHGHPLEGRLDGDGPDVVELAGRLGHWVRVDPDVVGVGVRLVPDGDIISL